MLLIGLSLVSLACKPPLEANHHLVLVGDITVPSTMPASAPVDITFRVLGACGGSRVPTLQRAPGMLTIAFWRRNSPEAAISACPVDLPPVQAVTLQRLPGEYSLRVRIRQPDGRDFVRVVYVSANAF